MPQLQYGFHSAFQIHELMHVRWAPGEHRQKSMHRFRALEYARGLFSLQNYYLNEHHSKEANAHTENSGSTEQYLLRIHLTGSCHPSSPTWWSEYLGSSHSLIISQEAAHSSGKSRARKGKQLLSCTLIPIDW